MAALRDSPAMKSHGKRLRKGLPVTPFPSGLRYRKKIPPSGTRGPSRDFSATDKPYNLLSRKSADKYPPSTHNMGVQWGVETQQETGPWSYGTSSTIFPPKSKEPPSEICSLQIAGISPNTQHTVSPLVTLDPHQTPCETGHAYLRRWWSTWRLSTVTPSLTSGKHSRD